MSGPQLVDPVRVGQEPAVEHGVGVDRHAVLEPERDDLDLHRVGLGVGEQVEQPLPELVDVELAGVDDDVGRLADGLEQLPLEGDALDHALAAAGQRVAAAGALEAADQHLVGRLEEEDLDRGRRSSGAGSTAWAKSSSWPPLAPDHEGDPLGLGPGRGDQLGDLGDQGGRHVVDHEPAEVLERGRRLGPAGAGQPGDDDELGHRPIVAGARRFGGGVRVAAASPWPRSVSCVRRQIGRVLHKGSGAQPPACGA